jgi:predicted transcriptional regulator
VNNPDLNNPNRSLMCDASCERLLHCLDGHDPLDESVYDTLVESDRPLIVDDLARHTDRSRSAVSDPVSRLTDGGLVTRTRMTDGEDGYSTVSAAVDPERVAAALSRALDDSHARMARLVAVYRHASVDDVSFPPER